MSQGFPTQSGAEVGWSPWVKVRVQGEGGVGDVPESCSWDAASCLAQRSQARHSRRAPSLVLPVSTGILGLPPALRVPQHHPKGGRNGAAPRQWFWRRTPQIWDAGTPKLRRASCTQDGDVTAPGDTHPRAAWFLLHGPGAREGSVILGGGRGSPCPRREPSGLLTQRQPPPEESGAELAAG